MISRKIDISHQFTLWCRLCHNRGLIMIATNNGRVTARISQQIKQTLIDAANRQLLSIWFYGFAISIG